MQKIDTNKSYFIVSCARSGSTSLATILSMAANGVCAIEPSPNLNVESRDLMDGRLDDPHLVIRKNVLPRVLTGIKKNEVYGEKNVTYGPFIRHLYDELGCRFVLIKRDGRDVVRSLIDWHNRKFGSIYRECRDPGDLTPQALTAVAKLPLHLDTSDYSRPRPSPDEEIYEKWETLSRFEMCAYYWQRINKLYLEELKQLPECAWVEIDYSAPTVTDIQRVIGFLGLEGITHQAISKTLHQRINSLSQRGVREGITFPSWHDWDDVYYQKFVTIAGKTMTTLGYEIQREYSSQ